VVKVVVFVEYVIECEVGVFECSSIQMICVCVCLYELGIFPFSLVMELLGGNIVWVLVTILCENFKFSGCKF